MRGFPSNSARVVAVIQARMAATRLPGKVLLDIGGKPMLARVVDRTRRSKIIHQVVVATSAEADDDQIANYCKERGIDCYRGSLHDVLDRYYLAAKTHSADVVVRITADCPIIDPMVIDQTLAAFFGSGPPLIRAKNSSWPDIPTTAGPHWDFVANRLPPPWERTFPIGLDTEVCTFSALETAWREADQPHQREHVMPFLYENNHRFRILLVNHEPDWGGMRWTVDTPEDMELIREVYNRFGGRDDFSWLEVLDLFKQEPSLSAMNADIRHKHYQDVEKVDGQEIN